MQKHVFKENILLGNNSACHFKESSEICAQLHHIVHIYHIGIDTIHDNNQAIRIAFKANQPCK